MPAAAAAEQAPSAESSAQIRTGRRKRPHVPPEQRKRVRIACENCRRFKLRCNGQAPCGRCAGHRKECRYTEIHSPSTSQSVAGTPGDSSGARDERLRLLEDIFAKLHPNVQSDTDGLKSFHSTMGHIAGPGAEVTTRGNEQSSSSSDMYCDENNDHQERHNVGGESGDLGLNSPPIAGASVTVVNQGKTRELQSLLGASGVGGLMLQAIDYEGVSSYWSFFNSVRQVVTDDDAEADRNDEAGCDGSIHQFSSVHFATDWRTAVLAALPPRGVVDFLATTFFRFAQSNYFYIHPEIFSRKLTAFYNGTQEFENHDAASSRRSIEFISVVFMVFAIGSQFADVGSSGDDNLHERIDGWNDTGVDFSRIAVPTPAQNPGWRFYEVSRRLLPDVICSSSMTSVQVCVLQGIFLPSTSSRDAGYNLLGLALRMAINMGMHRSFGASQLHPHVRELRNRLWWSVYLAERLFSVEMGRPLSISDAEIDAPFPVNVPEWNISGSTMNVEGLIAMAKLCRLLGKIVDTVYCKTATEKDNIIRPKVFLRLKQELEQSRRDLPEHLKLTNSPSRSVAHLALTYEQGTILLTRSCLKYAVVTSQTKSLGDEAMTFLRRQAQDCMNSAVESIRIMNLLQARSLLCQYSFHDFLYCTAALYILLLGERLDGLVKTSRVSISQGVLILSELAKGSEAAASSLRHIIRVFQQSCSQDDEHISASPQVPGDQSNQLRGRMAWKAWMTQTSSSAVSDDIPFAVASNLAAISNMTETRHPRGLLTAGWPGHYVGGHSRTPLRDDTYNMDDFPGTSPNVSETPTADMPDLQPFWIPEYPEFDIFGRNLAGTLDFPNLA